MSAPRIVHIECVLMANGEVIHRGQSLGYCDKAQCAAVADGTCDKIGKDQDAVNLREPPERPKLPIVFEPGIATVHTRAHEN